MRRQVVPLKNTMSADIPSAFPAYQGDTLDALLIDPAIRRLFDEVHELNLANGGMNFAEARSKMNDFDRRWTTAELMGETATVTGYGQYYFAETEDQPGELVRRRIEEARVVSNGFTMLSSLEDDDGATLSEPKNRLALLFREQLFAPDGTLEGECPIAMSLDELESIRFDASMSLEQAQAIIDYYVPEFRKEMDEAILGSDDEIDAVMKLQNSVWDVSIVGDDSTVIAKAVSVYLEESLRFDDLPYVVPATHADMYVFDASGATYAPADVDLTTPTMISVNRLVFISPIIEEDQDETLTLTPHLDCWLHMDHKWEGSQRILLPLTTIEGIRSLREAFYGGSDV